MTRRPLNVFSIFISPSVRNLIVLQEKDETVEGAVCVV